jgi:hypothetical protein
LPAGSRSFLFFFPHDITVTGAFSMPDPVASLVIFSFLGLLFILFRPRRAQYIRRITRSFNGRGRGEAQK